MASFSPPLASLSSALFTNNRILQPIKICHLPSSSSSDLFSSSSGLFFSPSMPKIPCELANPVAVPKWRIKVSFFSSFLKNKGESREEIKQELFEAIASLDRGAEATPEDQERIDQIARKLEALNTIKEPLKSDLLNGKWELLYTTSSSILQSQRPKILRPNGKIYQAINADTLRAQNMETWPFFNQATADLIPLNSRRVAVKFDTFKIAGLSRFSQANYATHNISAGICLLTYSVKLYEHLDDRTSRHNIILIPIKAPDRPAGARGQLEITYLDEEIRVSRGNRGNLFVLKMADPSYRVPV